MQLSLLASKRCTKCGLVKPYDQFYPQRTRGTLLSECKACNRAANRVRSKGRYTRNPEQFREYARQHLQRHPERCAADVAWYKASYRKARSGWASDFIIGEMYRLARLRTKVSGFEWQVDHIVPIRHRLVCGLHTEQNMQVIPAVVNQSKKNLYWPDMP